MDLIHIQRIPEAVRTAFQNKLIAIANALQTNPNWLMQVMYAETGGKLSPATRNTYAPFKTKSGAIDGYATGLIQFIPSTARALGTSTWALEKMSHVQQLDYVHKYFAGSKGKLNSYQDVYLKVFFPAAVGNGNNPNYVFEAKGISRSAIAKGNPAININKDAMITMAEFKQYLIKGTPKSVYAQVFDSVATTITNNPGKSATGFFLP